MCNIVAKIKYLYLSQFNLCFVNWLLESNFKVFLKKIPDQIVPSLKRGDKTCNAHYNSNSKNLSVVYTCLKSYSLCFN